MEEKLNSLNKVSDLKALKSYVQSLPVEKLCSELNGICLKEEGSSTIQILFKGLSNSSACQELRAKIIAELFSNFKDKTVPSRLVKKLVCILVCELNYLTTSHLVTLTNKCLGIFQRNQEEDDYIWWMDLIQQLLIVIAEKPIVEQNGTTLSGNEFKSQVVNSILLSEWNGSMMSNIASMFIDIPLLPEEHLQVTNKLCKSIKNLKLNEIPPLIHQLLQLTKEHHSIQLFIALADFFDNKLYRQFDPDKSSDSSSTILKEEGFVKYFQTAEGTVLYHIYSAATMLSPKSVKDFVKWLKDCLNSPSIIFRPFFLTLLLNVSRISSSFKEEILSLLAMAISRAIAEEGKVLKSTWLDSVVSQRLEIERTLRQVIQNCSRDRDGILKGLIGVGFACLALKPKVKESQNDPVWSIAINLMVELVEKYPHVTNDIFQHLVNEISQEHDSTRYTDCLRKIAGKRPLNLLDSTATIMQLLANVCARLSSAVGQRVIIAVLPLSKMSPSFRDNFIIFLRKALFSNQACREMAVFGFLELLKHLKITDMRSLSQSTTQNYVGITQLYSGTYDSSGGVVSNEGLCLEILTILKQVFDHHHRAKVMLYKGVYDTFHVNRKLGVHILENLTSRLHEFYKAGECPPLDFEKVVSRKDATILVNEPLGHLLLGMGLIVAKTESDLWEKSKFKELLDSIRDEMAEADIPHFPLEKENSEGVTDTELDQVKIQEILAVYEALMGYTLCTWTPDSLEPARIFNSLFKGFSKLGDYAKGSGKGGKRKTENKKSSQGGVKKDTSKGNRKMTNIVHAFTPTILNLKCASRLLAVLQGVSVDWATNESTELLRNKRDVHRYAFNVVLQLITEARSLSPEELMTSRNVTRYVFYIGKVLYVHCLCRMSEVKEFDVQCATSAVECFNEVLNFVHIHFKKKMTNFFNEIGVTGKNDVEQLKSVLNLILDSVEKLLEEAEEEMGEEGKDSTTQQRKLCMTLLSMCSLLIEHMRRDKFFGQQVFDKILSICKEKKIQNANLAKSLITLLLNTYTKTSVQDVTVLNLVLCLCDAMTLIDDEMEIDAHENFAVVNEKTAGHCLLAVCDMVRQSLGEIEWALARCKAEVMASQYLIEESAESKRDSFAEMEKKICRRLNFNIKVLSMMCIIAVPPGPLADGVLREVANMYNKLVSTIKYFMYKYSKYRETFQSTGFIKTIKMADHELSKNMYCFTEHIIADGSASTDEPPLKKHKADATALKNKVLKETKIIPKVIYEKEQFQKFVLQLSNKTKIDLELKNSMARDYRLYAKQVKEIIDKDNEYMEQVLMEKEEGSDGESSPVSKRIKTQE